MDGIAAAEQLRDENLEYFKVLSTVPMIHRDDTAAWQMVSMQPLIQLNENGTVYRIVDNPACRDSNQYWTPPAIWFEAYGAFRSIVEDSSHHFVYPMVSGDITIFDNWRVYHGRQGFPDQGEAQSRFMTGMYCTRTHLNSAVRLLEARLMATDSAVASS
jgi:trimethyllysine dioxygenase